MPPLILSCCRFIRSDVRILIEFIQLKFGYMLGMVFRPHVHFQRSAVTAQVVMHIVRPKLMANIVRVVVNAYSRAVIAVGVLFYLCDYFTFVVIIQIAQQHVFNQYVAEEQRFNAALFRAYFDRGSGECRKAPR